MPQDLVKLPSGRVVMFNRCERCQRPASFGKGKTWWCGWQDGEPVCRNQPPPPPVTSPEPAPEPRQSTDDQLSLL